MIQYFLILAFLISCAPLGNKSVYLPPGQDYMTINSGKVHRSCLVKFGEKLPMLIDESTRESQACLRDLKTPKSLALSSSLQKIYTKKSITYVCNQTDVGKYAAKASTDETYSNHESGLVYPFISFNPDYVLSDSDVKGESISDYNMKSVLFHETIHFLGYRHISHPEYAYACEECCFPYWDGNKDQACKICKTGYKDVADPRYFRDFWDWADKSRHTKAIGRHAVIRTALSLKPASDLHLKVLLENLSENSMTAHFFSMLIPQKNYTKSALSLKFAPESKNFEALAKAVADLQYDLYYKGDLNSAYSKAMKLNTTVLREGFKFSGKTYDYAYSIWDWLLYDLDVIGENFFLKRKLDKSKAIYKIYNEILAYEKK